MMDFVTENSALKEARKRIKQFAESWEMELDLSDLGLEKFPAELIEDPDILHGLNLSGNKLEELPSNIGEFISLEFLDLSSNRLSRLPEAVMELQSLRKLKLNDNDLAELPENIDKLSLLEILDVSRNRLTRLPESVKNLRALKRFDFNLNKLSEVPSEVKKFVDAEKTNILTHIRRLADLASAEDAIFSEAFFEKTKPHVKAVSERFHITPIQAAIYAQFLMRYEDQTVYLREISASLNLSSLEMLPYISEIDVLEKKKLLFCKRPNESETLSYRVPPGVIESLKTDTPYKIETYEHMTIECFFDTLETLFDRHGGNELNYEDFLGEIKSLLDNNMHLVFSQKLREANLGEEDMVLFLRFCQRLVCGNDDSIGVSDIGGIFSNAVYRKLSRAFRDGNLELAARGLIEKKETIEDEDDFFGDSDLFSLTETVKTDMLGELALDFHKSPNKKDKLIAGANITPKKMFYNEKEGGKLRELGSLLDKDNFKAVQKRLAEKGLREGFACLFSGAPGTGKTETAYQLARESKRDLLAVNITDFQSKWVGESEKNLKMIFDNYREAARQRELAPILLFNEADGVISKRLELNGQSRSVDQMMNSLQNIILEEMEKLSGILIATTNLSQNLDKAFERRFLYKIEFEKPDSRVRRLIWESMLPALSIKDREELAERFDFSGGQIENIARKSIAHYVISGEEPSFDCLLQFCKEENEKITAKQNGKPVGFLSKEGR